MNREDETTLWDRAREVFDGSRLSIRVTPSPIDMEPADGMARSVGWGFADQALSSLTNFGIGILIAREVGARDFGAFAIAFGIYTVVLSVSRAITSEPLIIQYSHVSPTIWRQATGSAAGTALAIGVVAGVICVGLSTVLATPLSTAFLALGLVLPGLVLQDLWRYAFFARARGSLAFHNDLAWALSILPLALVSGRVGSSRMFSLMLAWGGAAFLAAGLGVLQAGTLPRVIRPIEWWADHKSLASRYLGESLTVAGGLQLAFYAIGAVAGLQTVGVVRAGQLLLGPLNVLLLGAMLAGVPDAVQVIRSSPERLAGRSLVISVGLTSASLVWGAIVWFAPDAVGREVLGSTWQSSIRTVPGLTLVMAASGFSMGAVIALRGLAAASCSLRVRLLLTPLIVIGGAIGAEMAGATGAAWGLAFAYLTGAVCWRGALLTELRETVHAPKPQRSMEA